MAMHKLLIHNDNSRRVGVIRFRECPPTQQWDARRLEVIDGHHNIARAEPFVGRQLGLAIDLESDPARSRGGQVRRSSGHLRTRSVLEPENHILDKEGSLRRILVSCVVEGNASGEKALCVEAQVLMLNKENAANKQPGS